MRVKAMPGNDATKNLKEVNTECKYIEWLNYYTFKKGPGAPNQNQKREFFILRFELALTAA